MKYIFYIIQCKHNVDIPECWWWPINNWNVVEQPKTLNKQPIINQMSYTISFDGLAVLGNC